VKPPANADETAIKLVNSSWPDTGPPEFIGRKTLLTVFQRRGFNGNRDDLKEAIDRWQLKLGPGQCPSTEDLILAVYDGRVREPIPSLFDWSRLERIADPEERLARIRNLIHDERHQKDYHDKRASFHEVRIEELEAMAEDIEKQHGLRPNLVTPGLVPLDA
jgi:hypothetical protein